MEFPKELYDLRKKFDPSLKFVFGNYLVGTTWLHYKGGRYFIIGVLWDSTTEEWAIKYIRPNGYALEFSRTITDWFSKPFVGSDEPRYKRLP